MREDLLELMMEFEEYGYVTRICPTCKSDCDPTEIDASAAYCNECNELKEVTPLI